MSRRGRGTDEDFFSLPTQITARAANAPGSSLGSDVLMSDLVSLVVGRAAIIRIDAAYRLSVRTAAASPWVRPFPPRLPPGVASRRSVASQLRLRSPASLKETEMMRLGKQYRVVREVSPCNLALWLSLAFWARYFRFVLVSAGLIAQSFHGCAYPAGRSFAARQPRLPAR